MGPRELRSVQNIVPFESLVAAPNNCFADKSVWPENTFLIFNERKSLCYL